ncbi:hypothetical protein JQR84_23740 (plasmid) [Pseudomonas luteola]|uniref:hypothetical protein n=1 Tax=Pseudomonas TaxID=286 RepID=UPI001EF53CE9|nr:hypothetical protein [Pseudomonas luteola]MCG7374004.1 hypothetical protein [Pseudomonas luteola]
MASETVIVDIDVAQLAAQKNNHYNLYLAKVVNGVCTVIWQSKGPVATVNQPSYEHTNTFDITIPNYQVNYTNDPLGEGAVSFTSGGESAVIALGQCITLDENGIFGQANNEAPAAPGMVTILNSLAGNPHSVLMDNKGNSIWVNKQSGMEPSGAPETLTPIDQYQVWFGNTQNTGTLIADDRSLVGTVTFDGTSTTETISFNANGQWVPGAINAGKDLSSGKTVLVVAAFSTTLTTVAVTYVTHQLISKFATGLKPKEIKVDASKKTVRISFDNSKASSLSKLAQDQYEKAVNDALTKAASDKSSGLLPNTWTLSEA